MYTGLLYPPETYSARLAPHAFSRLSLSRIPRLLVSQQRMSIGFVWTSSNIDIKGIRFFSGPSRLMGVRKTTPAKKYRRRNTVITTEPMRR